MENLFYIGQNFSLMKTNYLFPSKLKVPCGIAFAVALFLYVALYVLDAHISLDFKTHVFTLMGNDGFFGATTYIGLIDNYILDEILMFFVLTCGIVFAFSRERHEDELVASMRLHSLAWATIANYGIMLFCYLLIYGLPFLNVLMAAMFSQLLIFIMLFRYRMYRFYNSSNEE